jgi:hypothetical protein
LLINSYANYPIGVDNFMTIIKRGNDLNHIKKFIVKLKILLFYSFTVLVVG